MHGSSDAEVRLKRSLEALWRRAPELDRDGANPLLLCEPLTANGLFVDALPSVEGGLGLSTDQAVTPALIRALVAIGAADLSAGRLFEGHVNAVKLVFRYGDAQQKSHLAADVRAGAVCGVWNAESPPGLTLDRDPLQPFGAVLVGSKIYASGLGVVQRPLFTARSPAGELFMLAPPREIAPAAIDLSGWTVRGMRGTATGTVNYTGVRIAPEHVVGAAGDYYRSPLFRGGAWRFAAVQAGACLRIVSLFRAALAARGRGQDGHQRARLAAAAIAGQTALLWIERAAAFAEEPSSDPAAVDAYVNLARLAVERAALEVIALAEQGVGLAAFTRPDPIERVVRDLSTYLRQPAPDAAMESAAAYLSDTVGPPPWSRSGDLAW